MEVSCNVSVSIDSISVTSIEQAALEGAREAGKKLFLAFLEQIEKTLSIDFYGSVEKAVDVTICRRFKKRGMSWYVHKANPLLALKLLKLNGEWETYWRQKGLLTI